MLLLISSHLDSSAQNSNSGEVSLGKINVYKFEIRPVSYNDDKKRDTAVGTEFMADLYSAQVGNNTFFKIKINDEFYSVIDNPYGNRVSSNSYYSATILKDGIYNNYIPKLTHMAGPYFLALPSMNSTAQNNNQTNQNNSSGNTKNKETKQEKQQVVVNWELMGKVNAVYNIRRTRSGGEDDYINEEEKAFLYSAFDGKEIKYKIAIPKTGEQYEVYKNGSYNGAKVQWDRHGKRIWHIPSLSEMYTHRAGSYYFNVDSVSK